MKKLKILPTVLMLALCFGVLAVGVFAITPTKNTISGTITINASNPEVIISLHTVSGTTVNETPTWGPFSARSGLQIDFGIVNLNALTTTPESEFANMQSKYVVRVQNPTSEAMDVYFSAGGTELSNAITTKQLKSISGVESCVALTLQGTTKLPAKGASNGVVDMDVSFVIDNANYQNNQVNLSATENKFYLNIVAGANGGVTQEGDLTVVTPNLNGEITADMITNKASITKLKIMPGTKIIGANAFKDCTNLTEVELPAGLERIETRAFNNCNKLPSIELPSSLKYIAGTEDYNEAGASAFYGCSQLSNITVQEGLTIDSSLYSFSSGDFYIIINCVYNGEDYDDYTVYYLTIIFDNAYSAGKLNIIDTILTNMV